MFKSTAELNALGSTTYLNYARKLHSIMEIKINNTSKRKTLLRLVYTRIRTWSWAVGTVLYWHLLALATTLGLK